MTMSDHLTSRVARCIGLNGPKALFARGCVSSAGALGMARMASERSTKSSSFQTNSGSRSLNMSAPMAQVKASVAGRLCGFIMDDHEGRIMHRMRQSLIFSLIGFVIASIGTAQADLIQPNATRQYPDIAADVNGVVNYSYSNGQGTFTMRNTPFLLATGPDPAQEYTILPTVDGTRQQSLSVALDSTGNIVNSGSNSYSLYGTTTVNGQTFTGLLLQGTPTAFGSQDNGQFDLFDLGIKVTGGQLASAFGSNAYMLIRPELQSSFTGSFNTNFSAQKATSNTRGNYNPPAPVPEPATWMILIGGGAGLAMFNRRRLRLAAQNVE